MAWLERERIEKPRGRVEGRRVEVEVDGRGVEEGGGGELSSYCSGPEDRDGEDSRGGYEDEEREVEASAIAGDPRRGSWWSESAGLSCDRVGE